MVDLIWVFKGKKKNLPLSKPKRSCHTYFDVFLHFKLFAKKKKKKKECAREWKRKVNRIVMHEAGAQGDSVTVG